MNATLDQVAKYCKVQLDLYAHCIDQHPKNWEVACVKAKKALTVCADQHVEPLRKIKEACQVQVKDYDACLAKNRNDPMKCLERLKALTGCVEAYSSSPSVTNTTVTSNKKEKQ